MKEIKLLKTLYNKQAILHTISIYLENGEYEIDENEKYFLVKVNKEDSDIKFLTEEFNFNSLRFEIADQNKDLRKTIIAKALGSINVE